MADPTLAELAGLLRIQHEALLELIDIAAAGVKESGDSSVSAMHLSTRLNRLADALRRSAGAALVRPPRPPPRR